MLNPPLQLAPLIFVRPGELRQAEWEHIRIFEKVANSRKQQIFVSMWFDEKIKENFESIQDAVNELNQTYNQDIKWCEIRIDQFDTGYSYAINEEN